MTRVAKSTNISKGGQPAEGDNVKADDALKRSEGKDELQEGSLNSGFQTQNDWSAAKEGKRKPSSGATEKKGPKFSWDRQSFTWLRIKFTLTASEKRFGVLIMYCVVVYAPNCLCLLCAVHSPCCHLNVKNFDTATERKLGDFF